MRYGTTTAAALIAALCAGCATAAGPAPPPVTTRTVLLDAPCAADSIAFACARDGEGMRASLSGGRVRRDGDSLYLRVGEDRAVALADGGTGTPGAVRYTYLQSLDRLGQYLVAVYDTRGRGYALVDAATGRQEIVAGPPVVSPDGKRFVATTATPDADGVHGTLEVWRVDGGAMTREFSQRTEGWWAASPRWFGNATVRFIRTAESSDGTTFHQSSAYLRRDGATWRLDERTR